MPDWSDLAARMDAVVDAGVGDAISFSDDSGATWRTEQGFIVPAIATGGIMGMDEPLGTRNRVKLPRDLFGAAGTPNRATIRIQHARLGTGTFRPAGGEPEEQGRYILFDVQKV